ncbi:MAG: hypothetical protein CMN05_12370 [Roseibacillus sp.]|jgi:uncharacterized protein (DUF1501 family)|nr:hypothetical protein [Roseibacillus sp.]MBP36129.1 hypothetical protein [Roseibacillus sp.]MDP7306505.1 DUF1501 domain-containing protein [Roseibacillus sp.]MDP7496290.1 DUF1501 domain-containing protein [Roseibacillus sp.]MDP7657392.1 DUF1501 domain-containing protein [Roseibacillus sp.]|tara:strand:- start:3658 stop:4989 length:1332 start_codon:yes stop_codon:yes gene_type:complete
MSDLNKFDEVNRRSFMASAARGCLGVTIGGSAAELYAPSVHAADPADPTPVPEGGGKAKSVIYLFMAGGMTHLDTFDPKPEAPEKFRGPTETIKTKADGLRLGHYMPKLAGQADKIALVRSLTSTQGAHGPGRYFMRTGYAPRASIVHPSNGAWITRLKKRANEGLPSFVTVGPGNGHPGAGFFEPQYAPLPVGDATSGLQNVRRLRHVSEGQFNKQLALRQLLDKQFDKQFHRGQKNVRAYNQVFEEAVKLMNSEDLEAFDLKKENAKVHAAYGDHSFAQGVLLARRLVERGVRFIDVEFGGFDWHSDNFSQCEQKLPVLDQALSALLQDLEGKGLLESTLVVVATEFGRSPKIVQERSGRNHFPKAFSCLLAGGGIRGGQVYGQTDETGSNVVADPITIPDFNATIGCAMGVPHDLTLMSPSRRPFKLGAREGKPLTKLFG